MKEKAINCPRIVRYGEKICHAVHKGRRLTLAMLLKTADELKYLTGINHHLLRNLVTAVMDAEEEKATSYECSVEERIIFCLCKLKLNLSFKCLAVLFGMTRQSCSIIFTITLYTLAYVLEDAIYWPSKEEIEKNMPNCFADFKRTFVVWDCMY